jgi:phage terminase small subunit
MKCPSRATTGQPRDRVKLTPKQEAFCLAYLKTGNASEAYRQAYDAEGMKVTTIHVKASELLADGKVTVRLSQLQEREEVKALLSLEDHMEELRVLREIAKTNKQLSAAITAEVKRGELRKFYVKRIETDDPGDMSRLSDEELLRILEEPLDLTELRQRVRGDENPLMVRDRKARH